MVRLNKPAIARDIPAFSSISSSARVSTNMEEVEGKKEEAYDVNSPPSALMLSEAFAKALAVLVNRLLKVYLERKYAKKRVPKGSLLLRLFSTSLI